jgi:hypothetical protein
MCQNEIGVLKGMSLDQQPSSEQKPMFVDILNQLAREVQLTNEISGQATNYCNSLHLMQAPNEKTGSTKEQQVGVVGALQYEINRLKDANHVLSDCISHLRKVIGG